MSYISSHTSLQTIARTVLIAVVAVCALLSLPPVLSLHAEDADPGSSGTPGTSTETTDPAAPPAAEQTPTGPEATIATGDADATLDSTTGANTNDATMQAQDGTHATTTAENAADATTTGEVLAATGDNAAQGAGGASVTTGTAHANANIVHVINTNIFNAEGLMYFLNVLMGHSALDLRNLFSILTGGTPDSDACSLTDCDRGDTTLSISNQNAATVDTDLAVVATTGGNSASASAGSASVSTGDAYASANVVNVVNTNIIGANYLLLAVNNFGTFAGDIVFPGAEWFRELLGTGVPAGSETNVVNTNSAAVTNTVATAAATGDNGATASGDAAIATGDGHAAATVVNQVNTNVLGDSLLFLFRVHGSWTGNVFGLPEGVAWRETGDGIELFLDPAGVSSPLGSTDRLTVENTNAATVTNNVSVYALTGDNKAAAGAGDASVATGDAYAAANVLNVVNSNILGRNWVLAIFNIFGDWSGNIAFGRPDLWVGARALAPSDLRAGACFTYEVTVNNLGDAAATKVVLDGITDKFMQELAGFNETISGKLRYAVGRIEAHGTRTITIPSCLARTIPGGSSIETQFVASSRETDADDANNTDVISVVTRPGGGGALRLDRADLSITKLASDRRISASSSVEYKIVITNKGGPVYNALLVDTIYNDTGSAVHEQRWGLDTIHAGETIIISYTAFFNASTTPGVYTNKAFVSGTDRHPDYEHNLGNPVDSPVASVEVIVGPIDDTLETPGVCVPLLTSYIKYDAENSRADVMKLQHFLRSHEQATGVRINGTYDEVTYRAVHAFQEKYAADILAPWGVQQTTGYVYYTTQKKVNELWCERTFPLSALQEREIGTFREGMAKVRREGGEVPAAATQEIGLAPARTEETTRIATTEEATGSDQVAATVEAGEAVSGIWDAIRNRVSRAFSWLSL